MERVNIGYSTKNIPIPARKDYLKCLIAKTEKFLRSVRWRSFFFLHPEVTPEQKETYGFRSTKSPPPIPELKEFEDGMLNLVQNIEFTNVDKQFQKKISSDTKKIKEDDKLLIAADKTTNFYKLKPEDYDTLLKDNITKSYKKAPKNTEKCINTKDKVLAADLELDDRIDSTARNQAFVTLKDHKPNFANKPKCRLINPTKPEIGKISKQILEKINQKILTKLPLNQWKNTNEVINWYRQIEDKSKQSFICFDICEFYPSITQDLLLKALNFASDFDNITLQEKNIILQAKKSILYDGETPWCKRGKSNFDVTMGSFDGAETCELVGLYLLSQLQDIADINVGLYRDDGLATCNKSPRQTEQIKQKICKIFADNNLKITIEANIKSVDFLDITLDLRNGSYKPYMKPNNTPLYVHNESNHPPSITRNIPLSINKRLSNISSNEQVFNEATPPYQEALKESGYDYTLKYNPQPQNTNTSRKRNRQRNITWFNPPYSESVATNVGKNFLTLLDKCFPPGHQLRKILNRNTIKISYSCMPNMKQIISTHNKSTMKAVKTEEPTQITRNCNCRKQQTCPLEGNCLTSEVVYQATVTRQDNLKEETYLGLTENSFKTRFNGHTSSFRNEKQKNATTLSQYIWKLIDISVPYTLKWKVIAHSKPYSTSSKRCNLCLTEKYFIIHKPHMSTLNNRNELISSCRHRRKHLLCNVK
jgi:hypothetical protein